MLDQHYTVLGETKKHTDAPVVLLHHYIYEGGVEKITLRYADGRDFYEYRMEKQPSGKFYGMSLKLPNNEPFPDATMLLKVSVTDKRYVLAGSYTDEGVSGDWAIEAEIEKEFEV